MELEQCIVPQLEKLVVEKLTAEASLVIPENLLYLDGHFPSVPIVPGIVLLHWALQFAASTFSVPGSINKIKNLKFTNAMRPKAQVNLYFSYDPTKLAMQFKYSNLNLSYASGTVIYNEATHGV